MDEKNKKQGDVIFGRNPVFEAVKSGRAIDSILVASGSKGGTVSVILAKAKDQRIPVEYTDRAGLDRIAAGGVHQGVIATVSD